MSANTLLLAGESCGLKQTIKFLENTNIELEEQVQQLDKLSSEKEGKYMCIYKN